MRVFTLISCTLLALLTILGITPRNSLAQSDTEATNLAVVQRFYGELSAGNVDVILEVHGETLTMHYADSVDEVPIQLLVDDLAALKAANPDLRAVVHDLFAAGDLVIANITWTTTHTGDYFGLPTTGRTSLHNGLVVRRLKDGKIVESWEMFDDLAFLHSLGYSGDWDAITAQPPIVCRSNFEATVHQGPSAGLTLTGILSIIVKDDGALDGQLTLADGSQVATVGQANGRAINLMLTTPDGQPIFGVGTAAQPISQCDGVLGGPFVGPQSGDSGDWVIEPSQDDSGSGATDQSSTEAAAQERRKGKPGKGVIQ